MKLLLLLSLLTVSALASEFPADPCPRLERQERELRREVRQLQLEAHRLAERGEYPQKSVELGCEDVLDEATYVDLRLQELRRRLAEVRSSRARSCFSGDDIP